ncbi:hypothetical protein G7Y41_09050 [Schaalia sp. ZJ405]|uniref:hypothetical protein n=1 Tax=Schaalia sp. ZJ405 TaxID=2709403 RepID=UPI0013EA2A14|nr:hypothetical protein [Schaalia sp. ZJ405]QPK81168.1 hypothetical protein G7Y41_09050 [Schaalia sp. ZJ405]
MNNVPRGKQKEPSNVRALIVTVAILLLVPLPLALCLAGTEWLFQGGSGVPKEFVFSYLFGLLTLLATIIVVKLRERFGKDKKK